MVASVEDVLRQRGPNLSSALTKELIASGLSPDAARQRLSRAGGQVKRLSLHFPNKEKFFFLAEQAETPGYRESLCQAMVETNSAYGRALLGLEARGGLIEQRHFPIASGLPVDNAKGHLLHSIVEDRLLELQLISRASSSGSVFILLRDTPLLTPRVRAATIVENLVLIALRSWLVNLGWCSSNVLADRTSPGLPQFGQFAWDFVGPTYLYGVAQRSKTGVLNGFVVGDIILGRLLSERDLRPYFSKWESLEAQRRSTRFQPFLIADQVEHDVLMKLRTKGALVALTSVLLGEDIARDLRRLTAAIENAAAAVTNDPNRTFAVFSRLSKLEGAAGNLRGVLLEMIIAHLYKLIGYNIDIRQVVKAADLHRAEIDVKATTKEEVVFCECKAKSPNSLFDAPEISQWVDVTVPRIKSWASFMPSLPETKRFEFYVSSDYTDAARAIIKRVEASHNQQPIKFYTGSDIIGRLRHKKEAALVKIFREQFLQY